MKIVVFGYHQFTRICIEQLLLKGHQVALMCPKENADWVKQYGVADVPGVKSYWYDDISSSELAQYIRGYAPDYIMSIVFGTRVPMSVIDLAKIMAVNFHPADLPAYRGGNAWFWPIRMGEKRSAVTIHKMVQEWDRGDIVYKYYFDLSPYETQGSYIKKVISLAPGLIEEIASFLDQGDFPVESSGEGCYYYKVKNKDIMIDWGERADQVESLVRACNPNHCAESYFRDFAMEIVEAEVTSVKSEIPGHIMLSDGELYVGTGDYYVRIVIVNVFTVGQLSGKRFVSLYDVKDGELFQGMASLPLYSDCLDNLLGH